MALATLDDLAAFGGVPVDSDPGSPEFSRAVRLLELASALALVHLDQFGVDEGVIDGWSQSRRTALAAIVARVAARPLNVASAPNVDPMFMAGGNPYTLSLSDRDKDALQELLPGGGVSVTSVVVERDFSWITGVSE